MNKEIKVKTSGYYPLNSKMEGGDKDCVGNPLKTLGKYVRDSKDNSHVSLAVDENVIRLGSLVNIEGFNDSDGVPILFYACDVGDMIKGNHVDICCDNKKQTYQVDSDGKYRKLTIIGFQKLK